MGEQDVDGQQVWMEMTECQLAVSSIGVRQLLLENIFLKKDWLSLILPLFKDSKLARKSVLW